MPPKPKLHKDKGKLKSLPKLVSKSHSTTESQPSTSDSENQVQFEVELLWCIQQLQSAINSGKLNDKQMQDSTKTLNSLKSNSTPIIRKRQLMRLSFGDYRAKMAEEETKYLRKNEKIVYVPSKPSKKSVFVKKAPFLTSGKDFKFNFSIPKNESDTETTLEEKVVNQLNLHDQEIETKQSFHFQPSNNTFRFNFETNNTK